MPIKSGDRLGESTVSTGTGDILLSGAIDGTHAAFSSQLSDGDQCEVTVFGSTANAGAPGWMTFIGTYNSGANSVTRTLFLKSSTGSNLNLSGTNTVLCGPLSMGSALGKQMIPIPASGMKPNATNGAVSNSIEMTTNLEMLVTLDYDPTTAQSAIFAIPMPNVWDVLSTISFQPVWSHPSTTTNFGVVWELAAVAMGDGDAIDAAFGTGQKSTDTGGTANTLYIGPESAAITIAGSPVAGDLVFFRIKRLPADASDTMAVNARLHAIRLFINVNRGHE